MKVKEVIKALKDNKCYSMREAMKVSGLETAHMIAGCQNCVEHRNFTQCTNVFKCDDGLVGVTGLTADHNHVGYEKIGFVSFAEEYEEVQVVRYLPKEK